MLERRLYRGSRILTDYIPLLAIWKVYFLQKNTTLSKMCFINIRDKLQSFFRVKLCYTVEHHDKA